MAAMLSNTPEMYECHFGVPMAGAVLNALNTRLDAEAVAFMLKHGEAKLVIADREFSATIKAALARLEPPPEVVDVDDPECANRGARIAEIDLALADPLLYQRDPARSATLAKERAESANALSLAEEQWLIASGEYETAST